MTYELKFYAVKKDELEKLQNTKDLTEYKNTFDDIYGDTKSRTLDILGFNEITGLLWGVSELYGEKVFHPEVSKYFEVIDRKHYLISSDKDVFNMEQSVILKAEKDLKVLEEALEKVESTFSDSEAGLFNNELKRKIWKAERRITDAKSITKRGRIVTRVKNVRKKNPDLEIVAIAKEKVDM